MDDMAKLRHLLEHWMEHNEEHRDTYASWAEKAEAAGRAELAEALGTIASETARMQELFRKAHGLAG